jgi:hypothetical protein
MPASTPFGLAGDADRLRDVDWSETSAVDGCDLATSVDHVNGLLEVPARRQKSARIAVVPIGSDEDTIAPGKARSRQN